MAISKLPVQVPSAAATTEHHCRAPHQTRKVRMMSGNPTENRRGLCYGSSGFGICKEVERHQESLHFNQST